MLKAKIAAPPPEAVDASAIPKSLRPGQLVKLLEAKANSYSNKPPLKKPLMIRAKSGSNGKSFLSLDDVLDGASYGAYEEGTIFLKLTRREAAEYREQLSQRMAEGKVKTYTTGVVNNVGSDPEIFAVDGQGHVVPAFAYLPAKGSAAQIPYLGEAAMSTSHYLAGSKLFWDGFQAEFTTSPTYCIASLMDSVRQGLREVYYRARALVKDARLTPQCVVETPPELLMSSPPECVLLGCAPSHNAYFEGMNPVLGEVNPSELPFRFAGFHIHMGCGSLSVANAKKIVKVIDKIAGVASVCVFRGLEDVRRRRYYGLAGEFRLPDHGLEYRVLSSVGLAHPVLSHLCFDLVRMAFVFGFRGYGYAWDCSDEEAQNAINNLDVELAMKIMERNKAILNRLLTDGYSSHTSLGGGEKTRAVPKAEKLIFQGASGLINVTDMTDNWVLEGNWQGHSDNDRVSLANWKI